MSTTFLDERALASLGARSPTHDDNPPAEPSLPRCVRTCLLGEGWNKSLQDPRSSAERSAREQLT